MKKPTWKSHWTFVTLLLALAGILSVTTPRHLLAASADDLVITGVFDGPLTGGVPKGVELYALNAIPDLSIYGIGSANNGGGTDGIEFTFPNVSVPAGTCIYVASESTGFTSFFGFAPDYTTGAMGINGDDAIELFTNSTVSDVFGDINASGTGQAWDYLDGWAYRNSNTGPDGSTFTVSNWSFSGTNQLEGGTTNATTTSPFPLGTYSPCASTDVPPTVSSTTPADNDTGVAIDSNITINFSEDVTVTGTWFDISCTSSGNHTATVSGGTQSYTLNPDSDFANSESCTVTIYAAQIADQDETADNMAANHTFDFDTAAVITTDLVINEIHADPHASAGDANGDGAVNTSQDEFVEIVNSGSSDIDISGWTVSDAVGVRHTFPANTTVGAGCAIVVFAGGSPTGTFGNAVVQVASGGQLGLNNSGDTVKLNNGTADVLTYVYGSEGGDDQSLTRDPDITGSDPLVKHTTATGANSARFSPGTKIDGSLFSGCPLTPLEIYDIQGEAHLAPETGNVVQTVGNVVTAVINNGFYMQTPDARDDNNPATSNGIFVFTSSTPTVSIGDMVDVQGTIVEFRPGGLSSGNLTITEFDDNGLSVTVTSSGNALPTATIIGSGGRIPPDTVIDDDATGNVETSGSFDATTDGIDFYESLEGMLVQVNNAIIVGPMQDFGSSREVWVVGDNGANGGDYSARGGILIDANDFNPEHIQLDISDPLYPAGMNSFPNVHVGAKLTNPAIGVMHYAFGNYEVRLTQNVSFNLSNQVEPEVTTLYNRADKLTVASYNVENLGGNASGSDFAERADHIVNHLLSPDIVVLEEMQDNNGATNNGTVDATDTFDNLIAAIGSAGGPAYAFAQINPVNLADGGAPGGNIRVGFLYNPARVTFVANSGDATTANNVACNAGEPALTLNPGRVDPNNAAFADSRKPLAGEFVFNGKTIFVIGVHFSSKGGDDPLMGFAQPPILASEADRIAQAQVVNNFVDSILACNADANVLVAGDVNDFEFSPPVNALKGGVLNNLLDLLPANERYSYVFRGNSQVLDQILVSNNLFNAMSPEYDVVHVNAEFAPNIQVSDHDPSVARFTFSTNNSLYLSFDRSSTVGGVSFRAEDIVYYDGLTDSWSLFFDGSDMGLDKNLNAFTILHDGTVLMSFDASSIDIPGVGPVTSNDVVRFHPVTTGANTLGTFSLVFDGSDVEMASTSENIDGLSVDSNGRLILSINSQLRTSSLNAEDEDLFAFNAASFGAITIGTFEMFVEGSDIGLNNEDINGTWVDDVNNDIYLSTEASFDVGTVSGQDEDVFVFVPATLGDNTSGSYQAALYFDGSAYGLSNPRVDGLAIAEQQVPVAGLDTPSGDNADLEVTASDTPDPATVGQAITTVATVTNLGTETAVNTRFTSQLDSLVSFASVTPDSGSCTTHTGSTGRVESIDCNLGNIAAGGNINITIVVNAVAAGSSSNVMSATSDTYDPNTNNNSHSEETVINSGSSNTGDIIYISSDSNGKIGSLQYRDEDILAYFVDSGTWVLFFDGSLEGLDDSDIDGFHIVDDNFIYMSFDRRTFVPGIGNVEAADIVTYDMTTGLFASFFTGANYDLTTGGENIDAITANADGYLIISISGNGKVNGTSLRVNDEDLLRWNPGSQQWEIYIDSSRSGLTKDINAAWIGADDSQIFLSIDSGFHLDFSDGNDEDVVMMNVTAFGENSAGTYGPGLFFDGSAAGFKADIDGLSISRH